MQQQATDMDSSASSGFIGMHMEFLIISCHHCLFTFSISFLDQHSCNRAASFSVCSFLCSYGLEKNFQPNVYEDFEKLTLEFYHNGDLYGLEKYW